MELKALLFDCDGVLAETERDGHRVANNRMFEKMGIPAFWSVEEYGELVKVSGGKERLKAYFRRYPERFSDPKYADEDYIRLLHQIKTDLFIQLTESGDLPGRPGIARLLTEAKEAGVKTFVCSTSQKASVAALIRANYGDEILGGFSALLCGDIVTKKKPAPDIYLLAADRYGFLPGEALVVEDSRNGLLAAVNAGMHCLVTPSFYTRGEDFSEADTVVSSLGDARVPSEFLSGRRPPMRQGFITIHDIHYLTGE